MEGTTYRTRLWLRVVMAAAAAFWASVLGALARFPSAPRDSLVAAAVFLAFFVAFTVHYARMAIVVTREGLLVRSLFRSVRVGWDDILRVEVRTGLAGTLYAVLTRRGRVEFTSVLARHRELFQLMVERAELGATS